MKGYFRRRNKIKLTSKREQNSCIESIRCICIAGLHVQMKYITRMSICMMSSKRDITSTMRMERIRIKKRTKTKKGYGIDGMN